MRRISIQRMLFETINFLMALLFVIPLGVFMEQFCGYPLFRCCLVPCLSIIGYLLGRVSLTKPMNISMVMCGVGFVLAVVLSILITPSALLITVLLTLLTAFFSVFLFFSARKAAYTIYAPMAVSGILLHILVLICCTGFGWEDRVSSFTSVIAILYFLLALFAFSATGLRKSMHRGSGDKRVTYPAGMQMGNFLLVTGFIIIAAFISNIHPIFVAFSNLFVFVIRAIVFLFSAFSGLFDRRTGNTPAAEEPAAKPVSSEDNIMAVAAKGEASWITTGVEIFAFICVLLFFGYAAYKLVKKLQQSGMRLPAFLQNLKDKFAPVTEEDFVDETESLFDAKKMLSDTGDRLKNALKKMRERPQKIDDFEDTGMKVRFTYQQILKKSSKRNPTVTTKTPNEVYKAEYDGEDEFREFMDYYNEARYSDKPLPDAAEDSARSILNQKL